MVPAFKISHSSLRVNKLRHFVHILCRNRMCFHSSLHLMQITQSDQDDAEHKNRGQLLIIDAIKE